MYALCTKGFSVNFLTTFHDPEYTREELVPSAPARS